MNKLHCQKRWRVTVSNAETGFQIVAFAEVQSFAATLVNDKTALPVNATRTPCTALIATGQLTKHHRTREPRPQGILTQSLTAKINDGPKTEKTFQSGR